jgi:hypothetical protein
MDELSPDTPVLVCLGDHESDLDSVLADMGCHHVSNHIFPVKRK